MRQRLRLLNLKTIIYPLVDNNNGATAPWSIT
jgi:hypothetical protein